jgi:DmsE family decaheme c-type cytochrome
MNRRLSTVAGVMAGAALALLALVVFPSSAPAQTAAAAPPALPPGYAGAETCKACHPDQGEKFSQTRMGRLFLHQARNAAEALGCETCHGPGKAHVDAGGGKGVGGLITFANNDRTPVTKRNEVCLSCHTKGARLFWQGSTHESRDIACTNCHKIMEQVSAKAQLAKETEIETCGTCHLEERAQTMRSSHMPVREGKMTCTSCHNPHGTASQSLLKQKGLNETCWACHTEKRGPFLWTHPPVQENCANCHDPHGSNHEKLLKVAKPRLCAQCHMPGPHGNFPRSKGDTTQLQFSRGRQCVQCHANIHGSNHPGGQFFTR